MAALMLLNVQVAAGGGVASVEGESVPIHDPAPGGNGRVALGGAYVDFKGRALDGGELRLSDLVGPKVVLLQFWGIRCAPCLEEMKFLSRLQDEYGAKGLQVLGVNVDRATPEALVAALAARELAPRYPVVLDPELLIAKSYTQWLVPVTALIDRRGVVTALHTGYRPELDAVFVAEVEQALGRPHGP